MATKIKNALISVFYKDQLEPIVKELNKLGVNLISTGGTYDFIQKLGVPVKTVESLTTYPSILGGRVKTLHPKIFGGILGRRDNAQDVDQMKQYEIDDIDLVIVDLYPFEQTVASGAAEADIIEKIDIGGISLIRAAAKNFNHVLIVSSRDQYADLLKILQEQGNETTLEQRREFAREAFNVSSHYDSAIFNYFNGDNEDSMKISLKDGKVLRYGENPHQKAVFYPFANTKLERTLAGSPCLQGKEISYNNMLDADAAWKAASDAYNSVDTIKNKVGVAVVKHLNPCGLAVADSPMKALELAWAGDPVSAYGGIVCFTCEVDKQLAEWFTGKFIEIIIAPSYTSEALEVLAKKKNLRVLVTPVKPTITGEKMYRSVNGGLLVQDEDEGMDTEYKPVTDCKFTEKQIDLAKFGTQACKYLKSNSMALVSQYADGSYWLTGAGMGQPNRIDSLQRLTVPRFNLKQGCEIGESVLVSDAFFPFSDSVEACNEFGIKYIVTPGGSIHDPEVIEACNKYGIAMVFTGRRHFKH